MQRTWRGGLATLGIVASLVGAARPASADPSPDKVAAGQLVALVNQERATNGLAPLGLSDVAIEVAEGWSVHMAVTGVLAHNDAWFSAETKERAGAVASGENVAYNVDVLDAHRRLMESPQHRANILDPRFDQLGVGVVRGGDGRWWITEDFLELRLLSDTTVVPPPATAPPTPPPTAPPPPPTASPPLPTTSPPTTGGRVPATTAVPPTRPAPSTTSVGAVADHDEISRMTSSSEVYRRLPRAGDGIEVAGASGLATPATADVPAPLIALAAAGVLANAACLAAFRRRRLMEAGKGGKITRS